MQRQADSLTWENARKRVLTCGFPVSPLPGVSRSFPTSCVTLVSRCHRRRDDDGVPVWSTRRKGDPASVGHRMAGDGYGRPSSPVCGLSSDGLFFRAWTDSEQVPERQRCEACD
jgi:hypothetical protein